MFYQLNKGEDYDINGTNLKNWLNTYKANLTDITLEDKGKATIENMSSIFRDFRNIQNIDFSNFNRSNVTSCYRMLYNCRNITNISGINFPNCNNFEYAFCNCFNLKTFPIKPESFKNDITYKSIYQNCYNLTEDIANININNCILDNSFNGCRNITKIYNLNISNCLLNKPFINMSNVTDVYDVTLNNCSWMSDLFKGMTLLKNIYNLIIDINNISAMDTNLTNIFYGCNNLSSESYANIVNSLPNAIYIKNPYLVNLGLNINNFNTEQLKILGNKLYADAIPYIINTSNVSTYWNIRNDSTWINIEKGNYDVHGMNLIANILSSFENVYIEDTGNEGTLYSMASLFYRKSIIQTLDITNLKTEKVIKANNAFSTCTNLISISNFDTSNVITMAYMFKDCTNLTTVPNFDTSNVTNMRSMFSACHNLITIPEYDISNVITVAYMFYNCQNLTAVPNFNIINVTNISFMFYNCQNLTNIPQFNTSNVTDMSSTFRGCSNLTTVSNFDTSSVVTMSGMFLQCNNLNLVPNFNTSNVTDMTAMFQECFNLTNVPNFNTSNVVSMYMMLANCNNLVDIPQFNVANLVNIRGIIEYCNNLSNASIQNIINMCLNSNIPISDRNLYINNSSSPFRHTIFNSSYYSNRLSELTAAGWTY